MPEGFKQQGKVLQLRRNLYGLKQAPRNFYKYTVTQMDEVGLVQSNHDPCLFIGPAVIAVQYVDDLLFWSKEDKEIDFTINNLKLLGVDLEKEGDACGYLGVKMVKDPKTGEIVLTQEGLTQRIIKALGLDEADSTGKATPAEKQPLTKDEFGEPPHRKFSYASIIGQLLYLAGHSRPDITFAVHQAARFSFCCKRSHEVALIRIGRYLKATSKKGMALRPTKELKVDCYPDADFAGLWPYEDDQNPTCVKSRTGFVITLSDCPVLWQSKLQTEIAMSTMEAEYVALSASCRELFPIVDLAKELGAATKLPIKDDASMHISIH